MTRPDPKHDDNNDVRNPSPADPSHEPFDIGEENTGNTIDSVDPATDPGNYRDPAAGGDPAV